MVVAEIHLEIPSRVAEEFKTAAKRAWPREAFAYLLGQDAGSEIAVEELYFPDGVDQHCTEDAVYAPPHWEIEARLYAQEAGLSVVGDIHSHPRRYSMWFGSRSDRAPSENDHESGWRGIAGVCVVTEQKSGRLYARAPKFYSTSIPVKARMV